MIRHALYFLVLNDTKGIFLNVNEKETSIVSTSCYQDGPLEAGRSYLFASSGSVCVCKCRARQGYHVGTGYSKHSKSDKP